MPTIGTEAHAKINLWLTVGEKRPDGFHEIETLMQRVSLCDFVSVTRNPPRGEKKIAVHTSDPSLPTDRRNIVWKCAEAFFEACGIGEYDVFIDIEKHVPSAAGLGGGSSDGAATLRLLNQLYHSHTPTDVLCRIGAKAGADIPFCVSGLSRCICRGKGEILSETPQSSLSGGPHPLPLFSCAAVIVKSPALSVSTAEAYRMLDKTPPAPSDRFIREQGFSKFLAEIGAGEIPRTLFNDFERIAPDGVFRLKEKFFSLGAVSSLMSGSGPSVYGLFARFSEAEAARDALAEEGLGAWAVRLL